MNQLFGLRIALRPTIIVDAVCVDAISVVSALTFLQRRPGPSWVSTVFVDAGPGRAFAEAGTTGRKIACNERFLQRRAVPLVCIGRMHLFAVLADELCCWESQATGSDRGRAWSTATGYEHEHLVNLWATSHAAWVAGKTATGLRLASFANSDGRALSVHVVRGHCLRSISPFCDGEQAAAVCRSGGEGAADTISLWSTSAPSELRQQTLPGAASRLAAVYVRTEGRFGLLVNEPVQRCNLRRGGLGPVRGHYSVDAVLFAVDQDMTALRKIKLGGMNQEWIPPIVGVTSHNLAVAIGSAQELGLVAEDLDRETLQWVFTVRQSAGAMYVHLLRHVPVRRGSPAMQPSETLIWRVSPGGRNTRTLLVPPVLSSSGKLDICPDRDGAATTVAQSSSPTLRTGETLPVSIARVSLRPER